MEDKKIVLLKEMPLAPINTVVKLDDGFTQWGDELKFKSGKYKYELKSGTDFRDFDASKDSTLTEKNAPAPISAYVGYALAIAAVGGALYFGHKKGKGKGWIAGVAIVGALAAQIGGRMAGSAIMPKYEPKK